MRYYAEGVMGPSEHVREYVTKWEQRTVIELMSHQNTRKPQQKSPLIYMYKYMHMYVQ